MSPSDRGFEDHHQAVKSALIIAASTDFDGINKHAHNFMMMLADHVDAMDKEYDKLLDEYNEYKRQHPSGKSSPT